MLALAVLALAPRPTRAASTADTSAPGVAAPGVAPPGAATPDAAASVRAARRNADPRRFLPDDDALPGWELTGPPRVFDGKTLSTHIDGGAEEFLARGFRSLGVCGYQKDSMEVVAEIYDMGARRGARAILDARGGITGNAGPSGATGSGSMASPASRVGEACVLDTTQVQFRRDRFYVSVTGFEARPEVTAALRCLADTIDARIRDLSPGTVPR
jgi:hypothetical protein